MKNQKLIHIIEDDANIQKLIQYNLSLENFNFEASTSGEQAINQIQKNIPNLILLDLMLPGIDGLEICKILKSKPLTSEIPIIILSAKGAEQDIVLGLHLGADDYITKPFSAQVLMARIKSVLRRNKKEIFPQDLIKAGPLTIHSGKCEVYVNNEKIDFTRFEFQILSQLAKKPGWVFTRSQIMQTLHGSDFAVTDRTIDFQIVGLRKKLGSIGNCIETVRGVGYRFTEMA